jgi:HAD superfamily hydrolase (TIGR01509 family)
MLQAIIFDCFGVLATDGLVPFKRRYLTDPAQYEQATDMGKRVDAGLADYDDYVRELAAMAHIPEAQAHHEIEHNVPGEQLFAYINSQLHGRYKLGILSNAGDNWLKDIFTADQLALFDATCLSYETGFIKPQPEAYRTIAERLGVEPVNCLFVDDQERYCTAARDVGMQAITYTNFEQFKTAFEQSYRI